MNNSFIFVSASGKLSLFLLFASILRPTLGFHITAEPQSWKAPTRIIESNSAPLSTTQTEFLCLRAVPKCSMGFCSSGLCPLPYGVEPFFNCTPSSPQPSPDAALCLSLRPCCCQQRAELSIFSSLIQNPYLLVVSLCLQD